MMVCGSADGTFWEIQSRHRPKPFELEPFE